MDQLPRRLKMQLQASAAGFSSSDWDSHARLAGQAIADRQDAEIAAAAAVAAAASSAEASYRGRSAARTPRSGGGGVPLEDLPRSRSRSFGFRIHRLRSGSNAGAAGERLQRWASHDSSQFRGREGTDVEQMDGDEMKEEEEEEKEGGDEENQRSSGMSSDYQSGSNATGNHSKSNSYAADPGTSDDATMERSSRSRSFFGYGARGSSRARDVSAATASAQASSSASSVGEVEAKNGRGVSSRTSSRKRLSSTSGIDGGMDNIGNSGRSHSRISRFASFSGDRGFPAPPSDGYSPWIASTQSSSVPPDRGEKPATSQGGASGKLRPMVKSLSVNKLQFLTSEKAPKSARYHGSGGWGRGGLASPKDEARRPRATSSSVGGIQEASSSSELVVSFNDAAPEAPQTAGGGGRRKGGKWKFFRGRPGAGDHNAKKGLLSSLQRSLSISQKMSSPQPVLVLGRASSERTTTTASVEAAAATNSGERTGERDEGAPEAVKESADSAEQLRQMQRTIVLLEVELILEDILNRACLQSADRARERAREEQNDLPAESASSPAPCCSPPCSPTSDSPPSMTPSETEGPAFFGLPILWGSSGGSAKGSWGNAKAGGGERDTKQQQRHWNAAGGTGPGSRAAWSEPPRGTRPEVAPREEGASSVHVERGRLQEAEDEENFFQALRRKLFEGDRQVETGTSERAATRATAAGGAGGGEGAGPGSASKGLEAPDEAGQEPPETTKTGSEIQATTLKFSPAMASGKGSSASLSSLDSGFKQSGLRRPRKALLQEGVKATPPRTARPGTPRSAGGSGSMSIPNPKLQAKTQTQTPSDAVAEETAAKFGLVRMVFGES